MLTRKFHIPPITGTILLLALVYFLWQIHWTGPTHSGHPVHTNPWSGGSTAGGRHQRIAIITFITDQKSYIHLSLKNKAHYVKRHGYDLIVDYESHSTRGTTWLKFDMVERLINANQHDWIWWMDFDTLITNTTIKVEDIINESLANSTAPADVDFLVTNDCNGLNDGSFIVRSHSRSIFFLNHIRDLHDREQRKGNSLNDQESMRDFLKSEDALVRHAHRVPQWMLNAFPEEIKCYDDYNRGWEKGAFLVHFAGAWAHVEGDDPTGELMRKYEGEVIWGPDLDEGFL
ncbi:glycosyltransferase family 34 protein [Lepidopterella palustris CBS 459.81]|uniref:Glycosyltransferase family 34 protein n=1 Tax=Lepidopterella palustris CBS 459.81 TaxID=1314670 RepID=A0A8E2E278_9PEZI|nr:glycosyltransferase family 34 protein [Lepidopterella palustris CBS 459.81]